MKDIVIPKKSIEKKSGGIMRILFGVILIYGFLLCCYYGYKKYKEHKLCNQTQNNAWFLYTLGKHIDEATVYVESEVAKGVDEESALEQYMIEHEPIYKKGAPYDVETPFVPPDCSEAARKKRWQSTVAVCEAQEKNKEVLKRCKQNVGGFSMSTLYFGDGFYNYPIKDFAKLQKTTGPVR